MAKPASISDLLDDLIKQKNWSKKIKQHDVFLLWPKIVGDDIARWTSPHVIRGTVLWVRVTDSVWMQQLHLQKPLILEKINSQLQGVLLSDLRFQVDSSLSGKEERKNQHIEEVNPEQDSREGMAFDEMLAKVTDDPQIKQAVKKCWEKLGKIRAKNSS